jgi:hypothetical protein
MLSINAESSAKAQAQLFARIQNWMEKLLENDEYRAWKNQQIKNALLYTLDQNETLEDIGNFSFDPTFEKELALVTGYFRLKSTIRLVEQCEYYFRRYAFHDLPVSRHEHIATCCELFASRVYQFESYWRKHNKQVERKTKPKVSYSGPLEKTFRERLDAILKMRHQVHHDQPYSDIEIEALSTGELLTMFDKDIDWDVASRPTYRRIVNDWVRKVRSVADHLDVFLGATAIIMLETCSFLESEKPSEGVSGEI